VKAATHSRHSTCERGSALLIVFVFAAFVAIMLYREMPIAVFEAKRHKEQTLIDRGEQYKRAVKLFYKKFGMYPASVKQLEDTNRMRFLRHRFTDPFTGKDDWRLLHMGPGGMLVDSKVNPLKNNQAANAQGFGTNSGFGATSNFQANSTFGANSNPGANPSFGARSNFPANSGFGSDANNAVNPGFNNNASPQGAAAPVPSSDPGAVVVTGTPRRPPAMRANPGALPPNPAAASDQDQNGSNEPGDAGDAGQGSENAEADQGVQPEQVTQPEQPQPEQLQPQQSAQPNAGSTIQPGQLQTPNNGQTGSNQTPIAPGTQRANSNSMDSIRRMLANPAAQVQVSNSSAFRITSGGLAGVASKAQGHTIKVVNDQVDYSLWEFYYDPNKDVKQVLPGGAGLPGTTQPGATNPNTPAPTNTPAANPSLRNRNGLNPGASTPPPTDVAPPPEETPSEPLQDTPSELMPEEPPQ
jgi:hypothetical protein